MALHRYTTMSALGILASVDGHKWSLYTHDLIFIRELSEEENRTLNEELMFRSLPRGEDR